MKYLQYGVSNYDNVNYSGDTEINVLNKSEMKVDEISAVRQVCWYARSCKTTFQWN